MKRKILSILAVMAMVMGLLSVFPSTVFADTRTYFNGHQVTYGSYGVIYFTTLVEDFGEENEYAYINSEPVDSLSKADALLKSINSDGMKMQTVNIVLTKDWTTSRFISKPDANINIDLNGHTWTISGNDVIRLDGKNITVSGGTMSFSNTSSRPFTTCGGNISMRNVIFKDCNTSGYGLIYVDDYDGKAGTVSLDNVIFNNCYSDDYGGCIYINSDNSKDNQINNCRFVDCVADDSGGAVYVDGNNCVVTFNSCRFIGCISHNNGGAFSIAGNNCNIRFYDCSAFNCHADDCGGFMYVWGRYDYINGYGSNNSSNYSQRSIVVNCHALGHGGAVYFSDDTASGHNGDIRNFVFAYNAAGATSRTNIVNEKKGGAICVYSESVDVYYCDFYDNYAGDVGGAIYLQDNYDDVEYCTFENDSAGEGEGTEVYIDDEDTWVWHNTFYTGTSSTYAVYKNCDGSLYDNTFNPSASFGGGNGSAGNPYIISTAEHLRLLARNVNKGTNYGGKYFVQTADINNVCAPIGNNYYASHYFGGHYDGQGHTVTLAMYKTGCAASLFALIGGAEIWNVHTKGYTGGTMSAGVVGHADRSIIGGCTNEATVESSSNEFAGGIVAYAVNYPVIFQCKNIGKVSGINKVGGIAGYVSNGKIVECYNVGAVSGTKYDIGGIAGYVTDALFVKSCTNDAPITSYMTAGGIVGNAQGETAILNCYNTKRGVTSAYAYSGGILAWCDNNPTKTVNGKKQCLTKRVYNCVNYANIKSTLCGAGGIVGCATSAVPSGTSGTPLEIYNCASYSDNSDIYISGQITGTECLGTFTNCYISAEYKRWWETYPTLSKQQFGRELADKLNAVVKTKNAGKLVTGGDDLAFYTLPKEGDWAEWTVGAGTGMVVPYASEQFLIVANRQELGGKGTQTDPYTIGTDKQLRTLREDIQNGFVTAGRYFKITKNIEYTGGAALGSTSKPFCGNLDGAGHTVIVDIETPEADNAALFGVVENGRIENLIVCGMIKCRNYAAGIVSVARGNVTVNNCNSNLVEITAQRGNVGGICAKSEGTTVISNCHNRSMLFSAGGGYAGGMVGEAPKGTLTVMNCINFVPVSGSDGAGGLVGNGSTTDGIKVYNSANYGAVTVKGQRSDCGGLVAVAAKLYMSCCLNANAVTAPEGYLNPTASTTGATTPQQSPSGSSATFSQITSPPPKATVAPPRIVITPGRTLPPPSTHADVGKDLSQITTPSILEDKAYYGHLVGVVDAISEFTNNFYYQPTGSALAAYNVSDDSTLDPAPYVATAIGDTDLPFKASKIGLKQTTDQKNAGFSKWVNPASDYKDTNGFAYPVSFVEVSTKPGSLFGVPGITALCILVAVSAVLIVLAAFRARSIRRKKKETAA